MNILTLDLASKLSGWCCGDGRQVPACGEWPFPPIKDADGSSNYGVLLATLEDYLDVVFRRFSPDVVGFEAPLLITRGRRRAPAHAPAFDPEDERTFGDTLGKLRLLYPMGAFVEWYCLRQGVPCHEVSVGDIKAEVTGDRYAEKDELVVIARRCGLILPEGDGARDATDAWGGWLILLRAYEPELSAEWDSRIWTSRGALL